ncbi:hypothetical protein DFP72DRAFT_1047083 [Ephemerocybe angulata]|uniref:Uncharacterized protein n=1 Tax=Ephemerocybe angulata TaxID=980116 RepID=A0A8H6HSY4_9AGAR|nr:hypothetical protein DFP72DRAFT_1047083 [Tulosesus angulatus]
MPISANLVFHVISLFASRLVVPGGYDERNFNDLLSFAAGDDAAHKVSDYDAGRSKVQEFIQGALFHVLVPSLFSQKLPCTLHDSTRTLTSAVQKDPCKSIGSDRNMYSLYTGTPTCIRARRSFKDSENREPHQTLNFGDSIHTQIEGPPITRCQHQTHLATDMRHYYCASQSSVTGSAMSGIEMTTSNKLSPDTSMNERSLFSWPDDHSNGSSIGYSSHSHSSCVVSAPGSPTAHRERDQVNVRSPPPLNPWKTPYATVPLPSPTLPTYLNPILLRSRIRPTTHAARALRPAAGSTAALQCQGIGSLTIRASFTDRPIVVFPSREQGFVLIGDILSAVHHTYLRDVSWRSPAPEYEEQIIWNSDRPRPLIAFGMSALGGTGGGHSDHDRATSGGVAIVPGKPDGARALAATEREQMWGGLVESPMEKEVWILLLK